LNKTDKSRGQAARRRCPQPFKLS